MMNSNTEFVISLKNENGTQQFTGKNAILNSVEINQSMDYENVHTLSNKILKRQLNRTFDITLEMRCMDTDFLMKIFDSNHKPKRKISELRVEDCSIEELLFAVRSKIK